MTERIKTLESLNDELMGARIAKTQECSELRKKLKDIENQFSKLWLCLKFEKMSSKVIGYTFNKKDMDDFKELLADNKGSDKE